jgi:hypothetical protein
MESLLVQTALHPGGHDDGPEMARGQLLYGNIAHPSIADHAAVHRVVHRICFEAREPSTNERRN